MALLTMALVLTIALLTMVPLTLPLVSTGERLPAPAGLAQPAARRERKGAAGVAPGTSDRYEAELQPLSHILRSRRGVLTLDNAV